MSFDEIFDLTAGVYFNFYNIYIYYIILQYTPSVRSDISPNSSLQAVYVTLQSRVLLGGRPR